MKTTTTWSCLDRPRSHRHSSLLQTLSRSLLLALLLLPTSPLLAIDGRVLMPDGRPAAGSQISVVGRSGSVRADKEGRFQLVPDPDSSATLIIVGAAGEIYPPVQFGESLSNGALEINLAPRFQESVTVVSGVAPNIVAPPGAATSVVGEEDIHERQPQHLAEALEGVAGVSSSEKSSSAVPVIRGLARGRTLIVLDSARVTAERRAGASATFLDPFTLGSVEIARGPGSVAYGSDAFGGVIHARPRDPVPGEPFRLRYDIGGETGGSELFSTGLEGSGPLGRGALLGQLHFRNAGEGEDPNGRTIAMSDYRDGGGALRFVTDTGVGRFRLAFATDQGRDIGRPQIDSDLIRTFYSKESSNRLTFGFDALPPAGWSSLELRGFLGTYQVVLNRDRLATATSTRRLDTSDVESNDASLRLVASRIIGQGRVEAGLDLSGRFGLHAVDGRRPYNAAGEPGEEARETSIEDAARIDNGIFALYDRALSKRLSLSVGVRGDYVTTENSGGFFGDRSTSHVAPSGHLALTAGPFSHTTATIQVGRGFRDPTLSDRYFRGISGRGFVTGNPDLDPERSIQLDGALRWNRGETSLALLGYLYRIDDLIERFQVGSDFQFRNRGEAELKGIELEVARQLPWGLSMQLAGSASRGRARDTGDPLDDVAPVGGNATLRWAGEHGFGFLRAAAYAKDDRPGPTEVERPGYTTVDLGGGWRFTEAIELRVTLRNLTDRRYTGSADESAAPLAPGRSVSVGLSGKLKAGG